MAIEQSDLVEGRTEVEVVADAVAALMGNDLLGRDDVAAQKVARAVGISIRDIKAAWKRRDEGGYEPPDPDVRGVAFVERAGKRPRRTTVSGPARRQREPLGEAPEEYPSGTGVPRQSWEEAEKQCRGACKAVLPIERFYLKSVGSSPRMVRPCRASMCDECRKQYQKNRYLSVETTDRLGTILRFILQEDDSVLGDTCQNCHGPFKVGDEVVTDEVLLVHHNVCPGE